MIDASEAESLWIEAGAMSGGSRNQVEFAEELARYFGDPVKSERVITVRTPNGPYAGCTFQPKTTTFDVDIWRLSLPTPTKSGLTYADNVIHFTRTVSPIFFDVLVAPSGGVQAAAWRAASAAVDSVGATSGGREYGLS